MGVQRMGFHCMSPSGARLPACARLATLELTFKASAYGDKATGWWVCEVCCVAIVMWLEDEYEGRDPTFTQRPLSEAEL